MSEVERGLAAAGAWFAIAYAASAFLGGAASVASLAESAAYMGASAVASDYAHNWLHMYPSGWSSALGTGLAFAAAQRAGKGSVDYLANVSAGAISDVASSVVLRSYNSQDSYSNDVQLEEGAVSTA